MSPSSPTPVPLDELIGLAVLPGGAVAIVPARTAPCDLCGRPLSEHHPLHQWCPL